MRIKRGTVWPWTALLPPPEGWEFLPTSSAYLSHTPLAIYAVRDHDGPPVIPEDQLQAIEHALPPRQRQVTG